MAGTVITAEMLAASNVESDQVEIFRAAFPHGTPKTRDDAIAAIRQVEPVLDIDSLACRLLKNQAWGAYVESSSWAWNRYNDNFDDEWEYLQRCTKLEDHREFERAVEREGNKFNAAVAPAFINCWFDQCDETTATR